MEPARDANTSLESLSFKVLADLVLRKDQYPLRFQAMRMLARSVPADPGHLALLVGSLREADPSVRRRVAQTLGSCGSTAKPAVGELCETMRTDPMWTVREAAVQAVCAISWPALEEYRSADVPMQLVGVALNDREPLVRDAAIQALAGCLEDGKVLEASVQIEDQLSSVMKHPHASRRCRAIVAVCRLFGREGGGIGAIGSGLRDSHWKVRRTTLEALSENPQTALGIPLKFLWPELVKRLFDQHPGVQAASRETVARFMAAFQESQDHHRVKLLAALCAKPSAVETLQLMLQDFEFSPHAERQFQEVCRRRAIWHLQNLSEPSTSSQPASGENAVRELLSLAAKWQISRRRLAQDPEFARREAEEKEATWLLARWVESYFGERVVSRDR